MVAGRILQAHRCFCLEGGPDAQSGEDGNRIEQTPSATGQRAIDMIVNCFEKIVGLIRIYILKKGQTIIQEISFKEFV
jgi:hypothetical protein